MATNQPDDFNENMLDLIDFAIDNLKNARSAVGDGAAVLEGLLGAQRRIQQAIEYYYPED